VQVKSAFQRDGGRYSVRASGDHIAYTKDNIDFLVAYIVPTDVWYVLPVEVFVGRSGIWFSLKPKSKSRFERYREAWCLMACPRDGRCKEEIIVEQRGSVRSMVKNSGKSPPEQKRLGWGTRLMTSPVMELICWMTRNL
jgi:hypothetical protein